MKVMTRHFPYFLYLGPNYRVLCTHVVEMIRTVGQCNHLRGCREKVRIAYFQGFEDAHWAIFVSKCFVRGQRSRDIRSITVAGGGSFRFG